MDIHVRFATKGEKPVADKIRALAKAEDRKLAAMVKRLVLEALRRRK